MGINRETAAFLVEARAGGAPFREVLTLGRQNLNTDSSALMSLARRVGVRAEQARAASGEYAEGFFTTLLGAERVDSLDHSGYEGAALTHDLNAPVPREWEQRYDAIVDGGTLEHVFNFPVAIANCMRMLRVGGRLFIFTPANNQLGHGFYQFSPELFFRTLAPERGFEVERMLAVQFRYSGTEYGALKEAYEVADPARVGSRITLVNSRPVTLMVQARKARHAADPFAAFPQQSDYQEAWAGNETQGPARANGFLRAPARLVKGLLPREFGTRLRNEYDRCFIHSFRNKAFYTRVRD